MENTNNIFKNGSTWLRADFHLHTKADGEFNYSGVDSDFTELYINWLKTKDIKIGVITNHNKFDKEEFASLKKKAKKENIGLFPGVEFSLKEGIHILIVFDYKWYQGEVCQINKFLEKAFYGISNYWIPKYPNSKLDLSQTVKALDEIGYDYFIILAHIDDSSGLFDVLKGRTLDAFIKSEGFEKVLAIQKSGNLENYNRLCSLANRKLACIEGSDNAEGGIEAIGTGRITFAKIGDFNFEALKYALTDFKNRIVAKEKPQTKNSYIKSIAFEGGLLDGKKIDFSPELNNIIGIRGSGKSSILEIMRYTLSIPLGTKAIDKEYKDNLITYVLKSGGKVVVKIFNEHKEEYRIEKIYDQLADIYDINGNREDVSINAIFKQPVYFGQKDLSNKDIDFETDLIHKLIGTSLNTVRSKISDKKSEILSLITEIKKLRNLKELKADTEQGIKNAEHQLKLYKDKDVKEKLKQQTLFDSDISKLNEFKNTSEQYLSDLSDLIENYNYFFEQEVPDSEINKDIFIEAKSAFMQIKTDFDKLINIKILSQTHFSNFNQVLIKLEIKKENLKEEFARIKREIDLPTLNPDNFLKLNRLLQTSKLKIKEIEKSEHKRKELKKILSDKLTELNSLWHNEFKNLKKEVDRINQTENKLNIEVQYKGRKDKFKNKLKQVFKGTNIRDTAYQDIIDSFPDFIDIYKNPNSLGQILNENQLTDFKRRFNEYQTDLLTFQVKNKIIIKYHGKPLKDHSLGQRASALILFLLAQQENDILIIDQPEDDLDNQTIYEEVIKEIKGLKGNMQFIFATHNANIPVLGDSEKVVACTNNDNIEIELHSGTIDNHETQERIVDIMEGGKEAFNMRKNIYSIWKIEK